MRSILMATVVTLGVASMAYQYRAALGIAKPVNSLMRATGVDELITAKPEFIWPPRLNEPYPDLQLIDQEGNTTRLSDFQGRILLIEPIGMPCQACQAFCGGHERGGFGGIPPQEGLPSLAAAARDYGGFDLSDNRIVKIYLLLYSLDMGAPTPADAQAWARHYGLERRKGEVVLAGLPSMIGQASYEMIPGVQLVDADFVLRFDATGRTNQHHDLYRELLPGVRKLLNRVPAGSAR